MSPSRLFIWCPTAGIPRGFRVCAPAAHFPTRVRAAVGLLLGSWGQTRGVYSTEGHGGASPGKALPKGQLKRRGLNAFFCLIREQPQLTSRSRSGVGKRGVSFRAASVGVGFGTRRPSVFPVFWGLGEKGAACPRTRRGMLSAPGRRKAARRSQGGCRPLSGVLGFN